MYYGITYQSVFVPVMIYITIMCLCIYSEFSHAQGLKDQAKGVKVIEWPYFVRWIGRIPFGKLAVFRSVNWPPGVVD